MSGTVDIWRTLRIAVAAAALAVVLIVPTQSQAANDCAAAGSDPTAAQYCPPAPPQPIEEEHERCTENAAGETGSSTNSGNSSECQEEVPVSVSETPSTPSSGGGTLPFTGMDVLALLAVAGAFIAVGIALQRLSKTGMETK